MTSLAQVLPLADCDRSIQLEAVADSGACEAGRVFLLDFLLVRERVGVRWALRCEAIWDHTERTIRRHVQSKAIFSRVDQTKYLVSFASMDRFGAQALSFQIMEDVIKHFLGSCSPADLLVQTVASIIDGKIVSSPVVFRTEYLTHDPGGVAFPASDASRPNLPPMSQLVDERVRQSFGFGQKFNIRIDNPIALRLSSCLHDEVTRHALRPAEQAALATRTLCEADLNTFRMLDYLFEAMPPKLIMAPISIQTLTNTKSRGTLLAFLNRLDGQTKSRFVVEIYGLEDGTPASRLAETVALLRPFCRPVMARITSHRSAIANARAARLPAVSICAPEAGSSHSKLTASLLAYGEATRGLAPMVMATDLPSKEFLAVCAVAGFTHAAVKSVSSASGI